MVLPALDLLELLLLELFEELELFELADLLLDFFLLLPLSPIFASFPAEPGLFSHHSPHCLIIELEYNLLAVFSKLLANS